jgi:MFS family permease
MFQMSVVFSAFTLAYSLFEIPTGWMGDIYGARRVLTRIVLWWSAFTMLTGAAGSYISLVAIRFLFGAGEAGAFPNISRAFARWFGSVERGRANGILFLGSRLGGALAPVLTLLLINQWGWRASFFALGLLGILWAAGWFAWFRDDPSGHPGVAPEELLNLGQQGVKEHGTAQSRDPVPWRRIATSRNLYTICAMYFAFGYGLYFYFTWLPTYLVRELGFSVAIGGLLAGLPFVLAGAADLLGGWLSDYLARTRGLRIARSWLGFASFGCSSLLLFASTQLDGRVLKAGLIALALASADLALSACWAVCLDVGRDYAGIVTGFMNTFGNLGGLVAPMVVGFAVERWDSWTIPFYVSSIIYAGGALAWLGVNPYRKIVEQPEPSTTIPGGL